jgi:hypothetical protein
MNQKLKASIKILLIIIGLCVLSLPVINRINHLLYEYKRVSYRSEIANLFSDKFNRVINMREVYQSGERGTIYFACVDSLNFLVIEAANFTGISPDKLNTQIIEKLDLTDLKTYSVIFHNDFPVIQAELNPKKSDYLRILLEEPNKIKYKEGKSNHFYFSGKFRSISISNSQNCYIISFSGAKQEILVLTNNNRLYILAGEMNNKSLLEIINPDIL